MEESDGRRARPLAAGLPPLLAPVTAGAALLLCVVAIWLVDVRGFLGGPPALHAAGLDPPYLWFQFFMDGGPVEWFQWGLLALLLAITGGLAVTEGAPRSAPRPGRAPRALWSLLALFAALLLIEDAGNPRHTITHYVGVLTGFSGTATTAAEMLYFAALASIGLYAILRHGRHLLRSATRVRTYGTVGVVTYGTAAALSATRTLGGYWYEAAGRWLVDDVLGAPGLVRAVEVDSLTTFDLHFLFVDFVVEESLELVGAAFLVAAVLAHVREGTSSDGVPGSASPSGSGSVDG